MSADLHTREDIIKKLADFADMYLQCAHTVMFMHPEHSTEYRIAKQLRDVSLQFAEFVDTTHVLSDAKLRAEYAKLVEFI